MVGKFPFALNVTLKGKQFYLRTPDDLQNFCDNIQIPLIDVSDWYREFRIPMGVNPLNPHHSNRPLRRGSITNNNHLDLNAPHITPRW